MISPRPRHQDQVVSLSAEPVQRLSSKVKLLKKNMDANGNGPNANRNVGNDHAQQENLQDGGNMRQPMAMFTVNARDRLFHAIFIKVGSVYCRLIPKWIRTCMEIIVLTKAILLFTTLSYIHFTFSKHPMSCLDHIEDNWPKDGILVVQVIRDSAEIKAAASKVPPYFVSERNNSLSKNMSLKFKHTLNRLKNNQRKFKNDEEYIESFYDVVPEKNKAPKRETIAYPELLNIHQFFQAYKKEMQNRYIMEYSLEYGFLRLSSETRIRLKIPIKVVDLDPQKDKCFGDSLSRVLLDKFLGYDDLLMASIKKLAEKEENKGYMKNVMTGEHYKFINVWMGRASYMISLSLMFIFTICISTLLRFCHQQIFVFIIHLLQMLDWNVAVVFPAAPLFTVILSLVGMEAVMAEFFNDTSTSFYVILIVWAADQFDSVCCHTTISQRYWLRFFYLYHYVFYAYHYRFNGQYSAIALASSWFFIQHSMLYFLHNYELPAIEARANNAGEFPDNYLDDAVDVLVNELQLPLVLQPLQQQQPPPAQQAGVPEGNGVVQQDQSAQSLSGGDSPELQQTNSALPDHENSSREQDIDEVIEQNRLENTEISHVSTYRPDGNEPLHRVQDSGEATSVSYLWRDSVMTKIKLCLGSAAGATASTDVITSNSNDCGNLVQYNTENTSDIKNDPPWTELSIDHSHSASDTIDDPRKSLKNERTSQKSMLTLSTKDNVLSTSILNNNSHKP